MNIAIVGATGNVGRRLIEVLEKKQFPIDKLFLIASSKSVGKKINFKGEQDMNYNKDWEKFENIIDDESVKRNKEDNLYVGSSLNLINLSDFLIIKNWLNYAKILGDNSYEKVFNNSFYNSIFWISIRWFLSDDGKKYRC